MNIERQGSTITVGNGSWMCSHDLKKGGALCGISFTHGTHGNLLAAPLEMGVGYFLDIHESNPSVRVEEKKDSIVVTFTGTLKEKNGKGDIGYLQSWDYRDYGIHRLQQIFLNTKTVNPKDLILNRFRISKEYAKVQVLPSDNAWQDWRDGMSEEFSYSIVPELFGFFAKTGAGIQFIRGDDTTIWGYDPSVMRTSLGEVECTKENHISFCFELRPWTKVSSLADVPSAGKESLSFDSFLGVTNYKSRPYLPHRELVIDSQPFLSDAEIHDLADIGINVLRIHEGANFVKFTADHWMDGTFPPFDGEQLTEMKRLIRTAHSHGIKVIPYFMPSGVHPVSPAFREHPREWQAMRIPNSTLVFSSPGDGQVWETYFCMASQWHNWILEHVTTVLNEYGFDGFYFDSVSFANCYNPLHGRVPHQSLNDGLKLLMTLRKRFPDKVIFNHQMSCGVNVLYANIVDHIINLEEYGLKTPEELRPFPFAVTVQRACASVSSVPQPFLPKDGEAVSPGLVMVKYKPGREPVPTRKLARKGFPYFLVHGILPYLYTFMEKLPLGYKNSGDRVTDTEGFYYFYRLLKVLDRYKVQRYFAPEENVLEPSEKDVVSTVLTTEQGYIVLITSTAGKILKDVEITVNQKAPADIHRKWKTVSLIASTRDTEVSLKKIGRNSMLLMKELHPDELYIVEITYGERELRGKALDEN
ncbi:MAG: DUF6259 domain-containing protein [Candidatus Omnitrophota bacterium]